MAVQIVNFMPDAVVERGDPIVPPMRATISARRSRPGRAGFVAITLALHVVAALALLQAHPHERIPIDTAPIEASLLDEPAQAEPAPPVYTPAPANLVYALPTPQEVSFDTETVIATDIAPSTAISTPAPTAAPPMVDTVEYVRAVPPVYPRESQRRREYGTVVLRVMVDAHGRPAQIQVEHSSGFERLDQAAREAVEKFLFRPYEVNGMAQPAQVLIPIGFDRHAS